MASQSWAGIEGLEAEGLGFRSIDDFKNVDSHAIA